MKKNIISLIGCFVLGIFGGIFADQILWPYFIERPLFQQYRLEQSPVYVTEKRDVYIQENEALQNAIDRVKNTVVGIKTETTDGKIIEGSGFIVTSDGLMVTLAELVPQGSKFSFYIGGEPVSFQILKRSIQENLSLVKLGSNNLQTVAFANPEKTMLGQRVFLVGSFFEGTTTTKIVNEGIIKNFSENSIETNILEKNILAGSALYNIEGNILGINTIDSQGSVVSIPITIIREFSGL